MRETAPDDISGPVNTLADALQESIESQDATIVSRPEVVEASGELDAYLEENCEAPDE